uniref:Reelin domain-containing protein n=2 Tax=Aceria tosichella TaxID=561515 RepID=A0A6G1SPB7_9ACAR
MNMRPFHGLHQGKPASASQFFVRQSSLSYAPGMNITVEIMTQSSERHFRGFMVQSYNPLDGKQIGHFLPTNEAQPMACSAATHRNNQDKRLVSITWIPPSHEHESSSSTGNGASTNPDQAAATAANHNSNSNNRSPLALGAALGNWLGLPANSGIQKRHLPSSSTTAQPKQQTVVPLQQVRFRATVVVSYSEFYTGFESSELKFERFDYSSGSAS